MRKAVQGLNNLFYRIEQVPTNEMTDVMRVRAPDKAPIQRGTWVRMKRNDDYKDDLGQVVHLEQPNQPNKTNTILFFCCKFNFFEQHN